MVSGGGEADAVGIALGEADTAEANVVSRVAAGSAAARAGVVAGDKLVLVDAAPRGAARGARAVRCRAKRARPSSGLHRRQRRRRRAWRSAAAPAAAPAAALAAAPAARRRPRRRLRGGGAGRPLGRAGGCAGGCGGGAPVRRAAASPPRATQAGL